MDTHTSYKMSSDKRQQLFAIAAKEFTRHGFEQASLNRIIASVGISKSSFYHYFSSKPDLFEQIIAQSLSPFFGMFKTFDLTTLTAEGFWSDLSSLSNRSIQMAESMPEIANVGRMFYRNLDTVNLLCADLMESMNDTLSGILEHGQTLEIIREDLPMDLLIDSTLALGKAFDHWGVENFESLTPEDQVDLGNKAIDMFMRILSP